MKGNKIDIKERIEKITNSNSYKDVVIPFPKNILIECSNICNAKCIFCANRKMTRKKENISPIFLKKILNEAYKCGAREVGFYTTGEPLLNSNLEEYIKQAKDIGYEYIYITTNGILANIEKIKKLVKAGLDSIKFSINAINKYDYETIHGVDTFEIVIRNLENVYLYKKENNLNFRIYVSYISTKYTELDSEIIKRFFKDKCDDIIIGNVRNQSGLVPEINLFLKNNNEENKIKGTRELPCYYPFNTCVVTKEGYLNACCTDFQNYLAYADLNKVSLKESWNCDKIKKLRNMHIEKKLQKTLCNNCIYGSISLPEPLDKNMASEFNETFLTDFSYVEEKIKNFK